MAHNITERDKVFSVRDAGWHGLAQVFEDYPTVQEAKQLVHPWEPVAEDIYRRLELEPLKRHFQAIMFDATLSESERLDMLALAAQDEQVKRMVPGTKLNARSDDGYPLGVVNSTFETVSNQELYDIAEAIAKGDGQGDVMLETGGSLKGGAKVWLLIRLARPIEISGDPRGLSIPYYALQNAHDASGAFRGQATFTRIICDNTAQAADVDAQQRGTEIVFHHTSGIHDRIEQAKAALAGWRESVEMYQAFAEHMVSFRVTEANSRDFLERFIPMPKGEIITDLVRENIENARRQWTRHYESVTCDGIKGTAHGLVQASIEYSQHSRKKQNAESGFKRAYLDRSVLTRNAISLARTVSGA